MKLLFSLFVMLLVTDECRAVQGPSIHIEIRSEGCNDPGIKPNTCGIAYIKVDGKDHSPHRRGHNVVIVDAVTGLVLGAKAFDTHGNSAAGNQLKDYLNSIVGDKIVLVAIQDEGSRHVGAAFDALKRVGATDPILTDFRGSYALVGYARENKPSYVKQEQRNRGKGPSVISLSVLLTHPFVDVLVRSEGCEDPGIKPNTCGTAYIKVDGKDHSLHSRGHNVVILDATTGAVLDAKAFDTHGDGSAGTRLGDYLNSITENKIVLVAIQDEGSRYVGKALSALKRVGAIDPIFTDFRGSFALVGSTLVNKPSWIMQRQQNRKKGPSEIVVRIPLLASESDIKCKE